MYENVKKLPTEIYGLKYKPSLEPEYSNTVDTIPEFMSLIKKSCKGMTNKEINIIKKELKNNNSKCVLEIGVAWKKNTEKQKVNWNINKNDSEFKGTSTGLFLAHSCYYFGIDMYDRDFSKYFSPSKYFIQTDSRNIEFVMNHLRKRNIFEIDLLMIDGHHSVNMVINDWQYSKYLSQRGVIIIHDTNVHPGGYVVFDAIDETLFIKTKYFQNDKDTFGLALVTRRKYSKKKDWWKNV